ncbi:Flp pilus assembly protein CpaB [Vibrio hannami]|uniref:Flp pilus assembly protein CpaB n=1 Tax=Vibrio hannami TaxID=2717094 RepID=UPI0024104448|nr:Flp pilus assembly protein CpaB [Vibrio hannami]MDG3085994.1 Flp pilus assembly protein CpaB [Vibrio hannami]
MNLKIIVPIALIAISAGIYGLTQNKQQEPVKVVAATPQKEEIKIKVWKSKQELVPGQEVTQADLKIELLSEQQAHEMGIAKNVSLQFIPHMVAGLKIEPNELVHQSSFVSPDDAEYIDLTIGEGMVPYAIKVDPETIVGGLIKHGSLVDIIALSSTNQNLAIESNVDAYQSVSISPVLMAVRVIKVQKEELLDEVKGRQNQSDVSLIIELSRKQLARLLVAKNIAQLEVHKSMGKDQAELLKANSGDVLPSYKAIREYRSSDAKIR